MPPPSEKSKSMFGSASGSFAFFSSQKNSPALKLTASLPLNIEDWEDETSPLWRNLGPFSEVSSLWVSGRRTYCWGAWRVNQNTVGVENSSGEVLLVQSSIPTFKGEKKTLPKTNRFSPLDFGLKIDPRLAGWSSSSWFSFNPSAKY